MEVGVQFHLAIIIKTPRIGQEDQKVVLVHMKEIGKIGELVIAQEIVGREVAIMIIQNIVDVQIQENIDVDVLDLDLHIEKTIQKNWLTTELVDNYELT